MSKTKKEQLFNTELISVRNQDIIGLLSDVTAIDQFDAKTQRFIRAPKLKNTSVWSKLIAPTKKMYPDLFYHLPRMISESNNKKDNLNSLNLMWNAIEDAHLDDEIARVFELDIPSFLSKEESIGLIEDFSTSLIAQGMIVSASIHFNDEKDVEFNTNTREALLNLINGNKESKQNRKDKTKAYLLCPNFSYLDNEFHKKLDFNNDVMIKTWEKEWLNSLEKAVQSSSHNNKKEYFLGLVGERKTYIEEQLAVAIEESARLKDQKRKSFRIY